jgi:hypothetical protein
MSDTMEHAQRVDKLEQRVGGLEATMTQLAYNVESLSENLGRDREQNQADHRATQASIRELVQVQQQARDSFPLFVRWAIGVGLPALLVLVALIASMWAQGGANATATQQNRADIEHLSEVVHDHQRDGHPNRVEALAARNTKDIASLADLFAQWRRETQ